MGDSSARSWGEEPDRAGRWSSRYTVICISDRHDVVWREHLAAAGPSRDGTGRAGEHNLRRLDVPPHRPAAGQPDHAGRDRRRSLPRDRVHSPGPARALLRRPPAPGTGQEQVGSLCLFDTRPRRLRADQQSLLRELAAWVERELELKREPDRAAEVQQILMPRTAPHVAGYELAGRCAPAREIGGDFPRVAARGRRPDAAARGRRHGQGDPGRPDRGLRAGAARGRRAAQRPADRFRAGRRLGGPAERYRSLRHRVLRPPSDSEIRRRIRDTVPEECRPVLRSRSSQARPRAQRRAGAGGGRRWMAQRRSGGQGGRPSSPRPAPRR